MEWDDLPTHCVDCGSALMGGATKHKPGCSIGALIEEVTKGRIKDGDTIPRERDSGDGEEG